MTSPDTAPAPALYRAGQVVRVIGTVTGSSFNARIVRAEYSAFFLSWAYDIVVTSSRSNLYRRGFKEYGVFESMIRGRA